MSKYDVNIDLANEAKKEMVSTLKTDDKRVLNKVGAFASLYDFQFDSYRNPVLVLKTEEPGSKQLLAVKYGKIENVCYDMINHLVNDCIVMGATPLTVQDAIICGRMDKDIVSRIVKAIVDACMQQGCILTGGETSEQPGVLGDNTYILTSSIVGVVEKDEIIDGAAIVEGDVVISLLSSGIHTNGYTLVRTVMDNHPEILEQKVGDKSFIDAVLVPHKCYYNSLKDLFGRKMIHGLAHITGGGICENLNRVLPAGVNADIDLEKYKVPDIFKVLREKGQISDAEMLRTFNLGVGMALVTSKEEANAVMEHLESQGVDCHVIGSISAGSQEVVCSGSIAW